MNSADMAAWAASRGWTVVKIVPGSKKAAEKWADLGYRDPDEVRRAWGGRKFSVGILTGPSRLVCDDLDVDDEGNPAGDWALYDLATEAGKVLPRTFTLATPSGGTQLIWAQPNGRDYKTCSGQVGDHIDVRGLGGLFVLYDPTRPNRVITDDRPPAPMPHWLSDLHPEPGSSPNGRVAVPIPNTNNWVNEVGNGEPCQGMQETCEKWLDKFEDGVPHDVMLEAVNSLVGDAVEGHRGLKIALRNIRSAHFRAMRGKTRERESNEEWANALNGAIAKKLARKRGHVNQEDPCDVEGIGDAVTKSIRKKQNSRLLANMKSGAWLNRQKFPPLRFAVPELLPEGLVLLSGAPKVGKSTIIKRIGLEVSRGGYVFGQKCELLDTLYLALEDDDAALQGDSDSLLGEGGNIPENFYYITEIVPGKLIETVGAWLDTVEIGLVVVDTLGRAMEPAKQGETTYERDYRIMTLLKTICKKHPGSTVVVSHHTRKGKSEDWLDTVSGTNAIAGAADTIISLSRNRNETGGIWRATSRKRMDDAEYALILERPYGWRLDGDDLVEAAGNAVKDVNQKLGERSVELLDFVNDNPGGVRAAEVAKELGISPKDAGTYLNNALKRGDIRRIKLGLYGPWHKSTVSKSPVGNDDDE
jgi:Bifunctional DNA primase/polymerase, N-terminal/AAA domain